MTMNCKATAHLTALTAALVLCGSAHADAPVTEWRVLGPAFSYHLSKDGAQYSGDASYTCEAAHVVQSHTTGSSSDDKVIEWVPYAQFKVASPTSGAGDAKVIASLGPDAKNDNHGAGRALEHKASAYQVWGPDSYDAATKTRSYNTTVCVTSGHGDEQHWHQSNPALGLEYSERQDGHVDEVFGTLVRDSYGRPSLMAGVGRLWEAGKFGTVRLDAGIVGIVWLRSLLNQDNELYHQVVPGILPAARFTDSTTGLGLNVAFGPKVKVGGKVLNNVNVFMFQMTYLLNFESSKTVSVESTGNGGIFARFGLKF